MQWLGRWYPVSLAGALASVVVCAAAACGGGGGDDDTSADAMTGAADAPTAPPDAAQGSPLTVTGTVIVENPGNGANNATVRVYLAIRIAQDGAPVETAVIKVNPPGSFQTYLSGEPLDPSLYTGDYMGYNNDTVRLEITAAGQTIEETVLVGASLFQISQPADSATVDGSGDVVVAWNRPGVAADLLTVTADDGAGGGYMSGELADAESVTIPGGTLAAGTTYELRVFRARTNALPGASADSSLAFGVASYISIDTEATP